MNVLMILYLLIMMILIEDLKNDQIHYCNTCQHYNFKEMNVLIILYLLIMIILVKDLKTIK